MREVTERDIRMPEFRDSKLEDLEFRSDGKIVRKDRWETGIHAIRNALGDQRREFEIDDIVTAVEALVATIPAPPDDDKEETTNAKSKPTAPLLAQVGSTDGLGTAVPPAPTFQNGETE